MDPTDLLQQEHRIIGKVLTALDVATSRLEIGLEVAPRFFADVADFAREFAGGCHQRKEDTVLFPRLAEHGLPPDEPPISVLVAHHEEARRLADTIGIAARSWAQGDPHAPVRLRHAARRYVTLMRGHLREEDEVLFPTVRRVLDDAEREMLSREMVRIEIEEIADGVPSRYAWLAESLEVEVRATA